MIVFDHVVGFEWDDGNARKSSDKLGVSQAESEQLFFNDPLLVVPDDKHSELETRFHALGRSDAGRLLHVTFTLRQEDTLVRVISSRNMHRKERTRYDQES